MSYIKYKMSYIYQMCIEYVHWCLYIYMSINYIFSFPWGEGKKSLEVLYCHVEGDGGDDGVFPIRSLILLLRIFSNSSWYKQSRYESIIIIHWNQIYLHTKLIIFLPPSYSHSASPPWRLVDDRVWQDPTTIESI